MTNRIKEIFSQSIKTKQDLLMDEQVLIKIKAVVELSVKCLNSGGKILFCGNGGSAADAQHIAAELSGRFYLDRPPLYAEALHVNSSFLTAVANDYSFDQIYARMVEAAGKDGDILVGLSTSGNSKNVLEALKTAKALGLKTVTLTGSSKGAVDQFSDLTIKVPSQDTPRVQECHITIGHILCELIEKEMFG